MEMHEAPQAQKDWMALCGNADDQAKAGLLRVFLDREAVASALNNAALAKHALITGQDHAVVLRYLEGVLSWCPELFGMVHPLSGEVDPSSPEKLLGWAVVYPLHQSDKTPSPD